MSRLNGDDYERRDPGRCYGGGIGVFDRGVRQPDEECMEAEEAASAAMDTADVFLFINKFFTWALVPYNPARVWGLIFALDWDGFILGRSMAHVARELGLSRASVSNAAVEAAKLFGLPPSRAMRSKKTAQRSRSARLRFTRNGNSSPEEKSQ